ncbi:MAG: hypothetical protein Q8J64_08430 [Thermodesulfovibrionales bacterium]|nr:hypothetical protein [Thermodesulfovibrionales bacterium]
MTERRRLLTIYVTRSPSCLTASIAQAGFNERTGQHPFKIEDGTATDREITECVHTINKTEAAFRLVVLRWRKEADLFDPGVYCYHAMATLSQPKL